MGGNSPAVALKGEIIGVLNFTVGEGRKMSIYQFGKTLSPPSRDVKTTISIPGVYMGVWTQEANSYFVFEDGQDGIIESNDVILKNGAFVIAKV